MDAFLLGHGVQHQFLWAFLVIVKVQYNGSVQMYRKWFVFLQQSKISHFSFCNPHFSFSNLL